MYFYASKFCLNLNVLLYICVLYSSIIIIIIRQVYFKQPILGPTQERQFTPPSVTWGIILSLSCYRHEIEGTDGFLCLLHRVYGLLRKRLGVAGLLGRQSCALTTDMKILYRQHGTY